MVLPKGAGATHIVSCTGNEIKSTTRATMAGLNMFWPKPPNRCLATTIANKLPKTPIHQGAQGGRLIASNQPVSKADPSNSRARTGCPSSTSMTASKARAATKVMTNSITAGQPYSHRP